MFGGTALAVRHSLSIKTPTGAKVGKRYSFTVSGFAGQIEGLSWFNDSRKCGANPHVEAVVRKAKGGETTVFGSFTKTLRGWRVSKAGTYHVCAYLSLISDFGYYSASGVQLHKHRAYTVR